MTAMVQQLETAPSEASEPAEVAADVPASPASLWTSESRAHYSITHVEPGDARAWIDCDCVIHGD
ncbi:hypothetical protein [Glycomyces harbinensis]|uniref:Uncharacterized protein n=1 Tax=Glycomyces harbinensis TaxID=58114 RepID=A0A1G7DI64_9ACTN|nr:hypothetical protein [Glycomyces harbinensis]SDE50776.1 hypothetical protein SAMN05216270_12522 [Glycomyces harbinensis]